MDSAPVAPDRAFFFGTLLAFGECRMERRLGGPEELGASGLAFCVRFQPRPRDCGRPLRRRARHPSASDSRSPSPRGDFAAWRLTVLWEHHRALARRDNSA
jgi:hypothetical protein